ncbi:hypothetical protein [Marinicella rhabdoformis]|uniref:hypothetical protein n=1 Tax=Marinicella rhabdoformis TaxID=2580566 RepID=UPI0012AED1A3|nr:hypothetical protein [Marinicella rhabdoformis]
MPEQIEKIPLTLEPKSQPMALVPVMYALKEHGAFDSWSAARDLVMDLQLMAPQVVYVTKAKLKKFKTVLESLDIIITEVSAKKAAKIALENKPIRGEIKVQIRLPQPEIYKELEDTLTSQKLISHIKSGDNADGIYHWKDDRWYQDYYLYAYKKSDIPAIETIISRYYCTLIKDE